MTWSDPGAPDLDLVEAICARAAIIVGDVDDVVTGEVDRLAPLATSAERERLIHRSVARLAGLDALDDLMHDPDVDEVMVNRGCEVKPVAVTHVRFFLSTLLAGTAL